MLEEYSALSDVSPKQKISDFSKSCRVLNVEHPLTNIPSYLSKHHPPVILVPSS